MKIVEIIEILGGKHHGETVTIRGWVKSHQEHNLELTFLRVNDGTSFEGIQVTHRGHVKLGLGSAIRATGTIKRTPRGDLELSAQNLEILAYSDESYPIQKKRHGFAFLREIAHHRHRTNTFQIVNLIKKELSWAIHNFFYLENFTWIQGPIITGNNCEGGAEVFPIGGGDEFFGGEALLTVSGQFHAEAMALGLGKVYTFGPTFRAEKSNTSKHLAEFWMIEPEMAFFSLEDTIELIGRFMRYISSHILDKCKGELNFLAKNLPNNTNLLGKIQSLTGGNFPVVTYSEAIRVLGEKYGDISFGIDLNSEQEKYLTEVYGGPVFIINYPRAIKAFYMRGNDSNTVKAVDLLVPELGEIIGGSERESNLEKLRMQAEEKGIPCDTIGWYLDIRKYGYAQSSGFGIGFERLVMYMTGIENIRDIINFPRSYGSLRY